MSKLTPPSSPKLIVFEGLDGSGKSTCARIVAARLGARLMTTPSPEVRALRGALIAELGASQEARQLFYLATVFDASRRAREALAAGRSVVVDRYLLSTQAYAAFRGSRLDLDALGELLTPADLTVFMDAALEVRRARLSARGATAADRETLTPEADARLRREHFDRRDLPVVGSLLRLSSDALDPEALATRVVTSLARLPQRR